MALVVLPVPPFLLMNEIILGMGKNNKTLKVLEAFRVLAVETSINYITRLISNFSR
jgi:hypothetical protein